MLYVKPRKNGVYYSIWDWFNPKWLENRDTYIDEVYFPQVKELLTKYKPSVLYTDGDWFLPESVWRPMEILPWILNESPSRNELVINGRWGQVRGKHGGKMPFPIRLHKFQFRYQLLHAS